MGSCGLSLLKAYVSLCGSMGSGGCHSSRRTGCGGQRRRPAEGKCGASSRGVGGWRAAPMVGERLVPSYSPVKGSSSFGQWEGSDLPHLLDAFSDTVPFFGTCRQADCKVCLSDPVFSLHKLIRHCCCNVMVNTWSICCSLCRKSLCLLSYMNYTLCYEEVPQKRNLDYCASSLPNSVWGELGPSSVVCTCSSACT